MNNKKTQILAHMGASAYAPDNTLEAFALAVEMKADGIELDVHLSGDGEVVVIHDSTVNRTSNGTGEVKKLTLGELKAFNFYGKFPEKYPDAKIPALGEVYTLLCPHKDFIINVEIKPNNPLELADKCFELEKRYKMKGRIVYSSFDHFQLERIRTLDNSAVIAPLYHFNMVKPWLYAANMGADAIHPHYEQLYLLPEYVRECHARGIRVHPWTVNDEEDLRKLYAADVDAVITDKPDLARKVLGL